MFKNKNIILILGALALASLANATVIKEIRQDEDIKFFTNQGGTIKSDAAIDGSTGRLKIKEITNEAGSGAPSFPFGASGITAEISDFKVSSVSDPSATVGGGFYILPDGREIGTYSGSGTTSGSYGVDLSIDLDAMLGVNPADATLYTLAIDLDACCNDPIKLDVLSDSKRSVYPVTQSELAILLGSPTDLDMRRYVPVSYVRSADSGTAWSGTGSAFGGFASKNHPRPNVNANPIVYTKSRSIGTVGSVANEQGPLVDGDFVNIATSAYYSFNSNASKTGGTLGDAVLLKHDTTDPIFNSKGFFGRENVITFTSANDDRLASTDAFFNPGDTTDWSMGSWVYMDWEDGGTNGVYPVNNWSGTAGNTLGWTVNIDPSGANLRFSTTDGGTSTHIAIVNTAGLGKNWHHVGISYDNTANTFTAYLDGAPVGSIVQVAQATPNALVLGGLDHASDVYDCDCSIQDFSFEHRKLSDSEINSRYSKRFSNNQQIAGGHSLTKDSFPFDDLSGKVSYWNLNNTTQLIDGSGNGKTLTNSGGLTFVGSNIFGEADTLSGDGIGTKYLSSPDGAYFDVVNKLTFGGWVRYNSPVGVQGFISKYDSATNNRAYTFFFDGPTQLMRFRTSSDGTATADDLSVTLDLGRWYHLAGSVNGTTKKLYVNGAVVATSEIGDLFNSDQPFKIANSNASNNAPLNGEIQGVFFSRQALSDADIKKLASSKITTGLSLPIANQDFSKSLWTREDGKINNQLIPDWVVDNSSTDIYVDLGLPSGSILDLKIVDTSFSGSVIATKELDTGNLSASPTFPMPHGLPGTPGSFYILTESQTILGDWDERHDLCSADDTHITCNLSSLVIDVSHRVRVFAGMAPGGVAVQQGVDSLGPRSIGSVGSVANAQGALVDGDFVGIVTSAYYSLEGNANKTGGTLGDAVLLKHDTTDPVFSSKGFFGRENVVKFTRSNDDRLSSTDAFFNPGDTTDWSLGFWVEFGDWNVAATSRMVSQWNSTAALDVGFDTYVSTSGSIVFRIGDSTNTLADVIGSTSVSDFVGRHHVALTYDSTGDMAYAYVDGSLVGSHSIIADPSPSSLLLLGGNNSASDSGDCDCSISGFSFEHRKLSDSEVNARYSKRFTNHQQIAAGHVLTNDSFPFASLAGRVSYWNLNSTSQLTDGSGNGKTLTNINNATFTSLNIFGSVGVIELNGTTQYLKTTDPAFLKNENFTIGTWVKPKGSWNDGTSNSVLSLGGGDSSLNIRIISDNIDFIYKPSGGATTIVSQGSVTSMMNPGWNLVIVRHIGGNTEFIINSVVLASYPSGRLDAPNITNLQFGAVLTSPLHHFEASYQEAFYSNSPLSDEDIHKLYSAKITHNKNKDPKLQSWRASYEREDGMFNAILENGWITTMEQDDIYVDFSGMDSGAVVTPIYQ